MKAIKPKLIAYVNQYEAGCNYSYCQAGEVNKGKEFMISEIPYSEL